MITNVVFLGLLASATLIHGEDLKAFQDCGSQWVSLANVNNATLGTINLGSLYNAHCPSPMYNLSSATNVTYFANERMISAPLITNIPEIAQLFTSKASSFDSIKGLSLARDVLGCLFVPFQAAFAYYAFLDNGYSSFHSVGASIELKAVYIRYQLLLSFLKQNLFFSIVNVVQLVAVYIDGYSALSLRIFVLGLAQLVLFVLHYICILIALKTCKVSWMSAHLIALILDFGVCAYTLTVIQQEAMWIFNSFWILLLGSFKALLLVLIFVYSVWAVTHFDRGLRGMIRSTAQVAPDQKRILID